MAHVADRPSQAAVIESCTLLNSLSAAEKQKLSDGSFMAFADRGETIWLAGSPSEYSAIIGSGFVKLTRTTASGQEVAMDILGPGQALGMLVAIEGRPFPLSAISVAACWYLKIPTRLLQEVYQGSSPFKDQIIRTMSPRLRRAHDMMARLSSGSAEERIAAVLFILSDNYGQPAGNGVRLTVPLTRQEIGEMAGTTVETTIRVMSRWQKEGLIETRRHQITLLDVERLEQRLQG